MGWTHYWKKETELPAEKFSNAVADCRKILALLDVSLAGSEGIGAPVLNDDEIIFNGSADTGMCEPFKFRRIQKPRLGKNVVFEYCKTEHMPYDLAVQCCLVILKFHLGDLIIISSDGKEEDWDKVKSVITEKLGIETGIILSVG